MIKPRIFRPSEASAATHLSSSERVRRRIGFANARAALGPFSAPGVGVQLAAIAGLGALIGLTEAGILRVIGELVGSIEQSSSATQEVDIGPWSDVSVGSLILAGVIGTLLLVVMRAAETGLIAKFGVDPITRARQRLAHAFLSADHSSQQQMTVGTFQELISAHTMRVGSIATATATMVSALVITLALALVAAIVSPVAFVVLIGVMILVLAVTLPINAVAQRLGRRQASANTALANRTTETLQAATDARVFGVEHELGERVDSETEQVGRLIFWNHAVGFFGSSVFQALMLGIMVVGAGYLALNETGSFSAAGTVALIALRAQMSGRRALTANLSIANSMPFSLELADRVNSLVDSASTSGTDQLGSIDSIAMTDVWFDHGSEASDDDGSSTSSVLRGVDLTVGRGEQVGIVGASGTGKSTLLRLLLGLAEPDRGQVTFNGRPRSGYSPASLAMRIASVAQTPVLLSGTVLDNIAFFRPGITTEEAVRAARSAGVHDEIAAWPDGYDTVIGQRAGRQVSGGQAQRICIARALVGRPNLLVMDEPTSAVDARGERLISDTIAALDDSCAAVIVSHRTSSLAGCDRIYELVDGQLIERQM